MVQASTKEAHIERQNRTHLCDSCRKSRSAQPGKVRLDETLELVSSLDDVERNASLACSLCRWMLGIIRPEMQDSTSVRLGITLNFTDAYWVIECR